MAVLFLDYKNYEKSYDIPSLLAVFFVCYKFQIKGNPQSFSKNITNLQA